MKWFKSLSTIIAIALLGLSPAFAATVVVDFEEFSPLPGTPTPVVDSFISNGVLVDLTLAPSGVNIFADNSQSGTGNELGFCSFCGGPTEGIRLSIAAGGLFELDSMDLRYGGDPGPTGQIGLVTGYLAGGGTLTQGIGPLAGIVIFDSSWASLTAVDVVFETPGFSFTVPSLDNITLQTVPVPAAAWFMLSGLGLLGWKRRTQQA